MQTATTRQLRKIVRNILRGVGINVIQSWTDNALGTNGLKGDNGTRRVAFKIAYAMSDTQKQQTEKLVRDTLTLAGYDNGVKLTDSTASLTKEQQIFCRDNTGVYLRMTAVLG
jgi:hypothetical protein